MDSIWKTVLWQQFGASIDMLKAAIRNCPDQLWENSLWEDPGMPRGSSAYWYITYHTIFWLDLYLSGSVEGFVPPSPFNLDELDPAGVLPDRVYTQQELLGYLAHARQKCRATIESLTEQRANQVCHFGWGQITFAGLLLDNMRHVQEHAAQLNMFLGQQTGLRSGWIARHKDQD